MEEDKAKTALNRRVKEVTRQHLRSRTWEEKVASIERMNEAGKLAKEAMHVARAKAGMEPASAPDLRATRP